MMTSGIRWRKAITVSLLFHLFFLALSGYLAARLFAVPALPEQYIELDLASSPLSTASPKTNVSEQQLPADSIPPRAVPEPAIQQSDPEPVVTSADTMSVLAAEVPAAIAGNIANKTPSKSVSGGSVAGNNGHNALGGGVAPPRILNKTEPAYPGSARQAGMQGTVVLKIQILENGRPGIVTVSRSSGHEILDEAAITAVQQWRFVPAKNLDSGQTIVCYSTLPVSFRLK